MVLGSPNHYARWFLMVVHSHWPKDAIVTHRSGLDGEKERSSRFITIVNFEGSGGGSYWVFYHWIYPSQFRSFFFRHFYEEWHSRFCEGLLISKTFDWQGIKQWQRRNLPSEKEKIQFWRKTPLFRGFYAPRLPEREEGVWGVGEIAGIPGEENPLPFFPPFLLSQTFFLLLARLCPPLNLKFFRQLKLFRVRRLPWNPGLNHLKNVLI